MYLIHTNSCDYIRKEMAKRNWLEQFPFFKLKYTNEEEFKNFLHGESYLSENILKDLKNIFDVERKFMLSLEKNFKKQKKFVFNLLDCIHENDIIAISRNNEQIYYFIVDKIMEWPRKKTKREVIFSGTLINKDVHCDEYVCLKFRYYKSDFYIDFTDFGNTVFDSIFSNISLEVYMTYHCCLTTAKKHKKNKKVNNENY